MKDGLRKKKEIDGVTIYGDEDDNYAFYDADGNRFYSNYVSLEKAEETVNKMAEFGITAVTGPGRPLLVSGKFVKNKYNYVGVYIVNGAEKLSEYGTARLKVKKDGLRKIKEIDGVTIYGDEDGNYVFYDADGNRFYSNYVSLEEAEERVSQMAEFGITAVTGPGKPLLVSGEFVKDKYNSVGVYIVNGAEKLSEYETARLKIKKVDDKSQVEQTEIEPESLDKLLKNLEYAVGPAMRGTPDPIFAMIYARNIIYNQWRAYDELTERFVTSSPEELEQIMDKIKNSDSLTEEIKEALCEEAQSVLESFKNSGKRSSL